MPASVGDDVVPAYVGDDVFLTAGSYYLAGDDDVPACVGTSVLDADPNCDGAHNVTDILLLINYALGFPLSTAIDADGDGCPDACDALPCQLGDCDDGVDCTLDGCTAGTGCVSYTSDAVCEDDDECTTSTCDSEAGCIILFQPLHERLCAVDVRRLTMGLKKHVD